ncbi:MAG: 50S ribosomal protein L24 [bacterium]|nr:50S ribosomal protein L24 [bacterium]
MNIRKGDNVIMRGGKDRRKTGKVLAVLTKENRVVIEGLNTVKRHLKARKQGQKGQVINKERAVPLSTVQLVCSKCGKRTRVGIQVSGDKKIRVCKKCGGEI